MARVVAKQLRFQTHKRIPRKRLTNVAQKRRLTSHESRKFGAAKLVLVVERSPGYLANLLGHQPHFTSLMILSISLIPSRTIGA